MYTYMVGDLHPYRKNQIPQPIAKVHNWLLDNIIIHLLLIKWNGMLRNFKVIVY